MKKIIMFIIILVFSSLALFSDTNYNHSHLDGKWYAYAYFKEGGEYTRIEGGVLFFEFNSVNKVKLHVLDKDNVEIVFSERKFINDFYYTHIKIKETGEDWLIQEGNPVEGFSILYVLEGSFPYNFKVDYKVLISKEENYFTLDKK